MKQKDEQLEVFLTCPLSLDNFCQMLDHIWIMYPDGNFDPPEGLADRWERWLTHAPAADGSGDFEYPVGKDLAESFARSEHGIPRGAFVSRETKDHPRHRAIGAAAALLDLVVAMIGSEPDEWLWTVAQHNFHGLLKFLITPLDQDEPLDEVQLLDRILLRSGNG